MCNLLVLSVVLFAVSGLPVKELVHSVRIFENSSLPALRVPLEISRNFVNTTEFIFGGSPAQNGQIPNQALLYYTSTDGVQYICGGSVISATHILTAAHCVYDLVSGSVMAGGVSVQNTSSPREQWRAVSRVVAHSDYDISNNYIIDDIAVVEISSEFELNENLKVATIVADDEELLEEPTAVVSGFGIYKIENTTGFHSNELRYSEVDLFSLNYCNETWNGALTTDTVICAGAAGRGIALGDSGGPIHVRYNGKHVQIGITCFGGDDMEGQHNQDKVPALFTRVSKYCDFIDEATKGVVKCGNVSTTIAPSNTLDTL